MSTLPVFVVLGLVFAAAVVNWRLGVVLVFVMGFAQDPLRKLLPGEPPYVVVFAAVVFAGVVLGLLARHYRFRPSSIPGWNNGVAQAMVAVAVIVILQLVHAYYNYHNLTILGLGVLSYLAPIAAVFAGYYYACEAGDRGVERLMLVYCALCVISTMGIYAEYLGFEHAMLGEVGTGLVIYDLGTVLHPYSGLFRSSEIAAWHIFLGTGLMVILAVKSRSNMIRLGLIFGVLFLVLAGFLTGRRKLVITILIFVLCYWSINLIIVKRAFRLTLMIVSLGSAVIWLAMESQLIAGAGRARTSVHLGTTVAQEARASALLEQRFGCTERVLPMPMGLPVPLRPRITTA